MFKFKHIALAASLAALTAGYSVAAEETFVTIGTGGCHRCLLSHGWGYLSLGK